MAEGGGRETGRPTRERNVNPTADEIERVARLMHDKAMEWMAKEGRAILAWELLSQLNRDRYRFVSHAVLMSFPVAEACA